MIHYRRAVHESEIRRFSMHAQITNAARHPGPRRRPTIAQKTEYPDIATLNQSVQNNHRYRFQSDAYQRLLLVCGNEFDAEKDSTNDDTASPSAAQVRGEILRRLKTENVRNSKHACMGNSFIVSKFFT